jgi:hypothetical protein
MINPSPSDSNGGGALANITSRGPAELLPRGQCLLLAEFFRDLAFLNAVDLHS